MPKSRLFDEATQVRMPVDAAEDEYALKLPVTVLVLTMACVNAHLILTRVRFHGC